MSDSVSPEDDLQAIVQKTQEAKRLAETLNALLSGLLEQCGNPIANRLLEEVVGYLLLDANDGVNHALSALNNIIEQESVQTYLSSHDPRSQS